MREKVKRKKWIQKSYFPFLLKMNFFPTLRNIFKDIFFNEFFYSKRYLDK